MTRGDRFIQVFEGKCPNTGKFCEKLGDLRYTRRVSGDSFRVGFGNGSYASMSHGQQEAYDRNTRESEQINELAKLVVDGQCLGRCALADIDVIAYVSGEPSTETKTPLTTPPGNPPYGFPPTYCIP